MATSKTKNQKNVKAVFLYIPCPSLKVAKQISLAAISSKTAACANILPSMISIYPWKGKLETSKEVILILKTVINKRRELSALVQKNHPYEVPCIAEIKLSNLNESYSKWIAGNLK